MVRFVISIPHIDTLVFYLYLVTFVYRIQLYFLQFLIAVMLRNQFILFFRDDLYLDHFDVLLKTNLILILAKVVLNLFGYEIVFLVRLLGRNQLKQNLIFVVRFWLLRVEQLLVVLQFFIRF